jgi:hypothetical protein
MWRQLFYCTTAYSLAEIYYYFEGTSCLNLLPAVSFSLKTLAVCTCCPILSQGIGSMYLLSHLLSRHWQYVPQKCWYIFARLQRDTT